MDKTFGHLDDGIAGEVPYLLGKVGGAGSRLAIIAAPRSYLPGAARRGAVHMLHGGYPVHLLLSGFTQFPLPTLVCVRFDGDVAGLAKSAVAFPLLEHSGIGWMFGGHSSLRICSKI